MNFWRREKGGKEERKDRNHSSIFFPNLSPLFPPQEKAGTRVMIRQGGCLSGRGVGMRRSLVSPLPGRPWGGRGFGEEIKRKTSLAVFSPPLCFFLCGVITYTPKDHQMPDDTCITQLFPTTRPNRTEEAVSLCHIVMCLLCPADSERTLR